MCNPLGNIVYIALVKAIGAKVYLMNTTHQSCPRFEPD